MTERKVQNFPLLIPSRSYYSMRAAELIKLFIAKQSENDLNWVPDFILESRRTWPTYTAIMQVNMHECSKSNHSHYIQGNRSTIWCYFFLIFTIICDMDCNIILLQKIFKKEKKKTLRENVISLKLQSKFLRVKFQTDLLYIYTCDFLLMQTFSSILWKFPLVLTPGIFVHIISHWHNLLKTFFQQNINMSPPKMCLFICLFVWVFFCFFFCFCFSLRFYVLQNLISSS